MSIFRSRDNDPQPQPVVPPRPASPAPRAAKPPAGKPGQVSTQIARGSKVVGQISGAADLLIDGVVEGEIELESRVVIGADGSVQGKILAGAVEVGGKVNGNVQGFERVEVLASGSLQGDVMSPRVVIAEGAFFKGKVEMTDKIARPTKRAADAKPAASGSNAPKSSESRPAGSGPAGSGPAGSGPSGSGPSGSGPSGSQPGGSRPGFDSRRDRGNGTDQGKGNRRGKPNQPAGSPAGRQDAGRTTAGR